MPPLPATQPQKSSAAHVKGTSLLHMRCLASSDCSTQEGQVSGPDRLPELLAFLPNYQALTTMASPVMNLHTAPAERGASTMHNIEGLCEAYNIPLSSLYKLWHEATKGMCARRTWSAATTMQECASAWRATSPRGSASHCADTSASTAARSTPGSATSTTCAAQPL